MRLAASNALPEGGYRSTGVPVDVPINPAERDPIQTILRHYGLP